MSAILTYPLCHIWKLWKQTFIPQIEILLLSFFSAFFFLYSLLFHLAFKSTALTHFFAAFLGEPLDKQLGFICNIKTFQVLLEMRNRSSATKGVYNWLKAWPSVRTGVFSAIAGIGYKGERRLNYSSPCIPFLHNQRGRKNTEFQRRATLLWWHSSSAVPRKLHTQVRDVLAMRTGAAAHLVGHLPSMYLHTWIWSPEPWN